MTARKEAMEQLHAALAEQMKTILEEGVTAQDKETGEVLKLTPGANYLNAIRQFLKDNGIEAADAPNSPARQLADLPFPQADDEDE